MNSPASKIPTMMNNNLAAQLKQIGLCAVPTQLDDFIARVTKARCSAHQILEELAEELPVLRALNDRRVCTVAELCEAARDRVAPETVRAFLVELAHRGFVDLDVEERGGA